ncbi:MAG TPA: type II toxin-antitoxin system prevent-host-death family antitoxin [Polyangia bacterium]|nr:type II toxin-antitoxin system prevent-host-death family antitoxin [Polyangia bacterium]
MQASAVRGAFASVLDAVREKAEAVVVVRYGRPVAALVPLDRLTPHELVALERHARRAGKADDAAR